MTAYNDLINKVQLSSGFSSDESEDTLQVIIESLSTRMPQNEREQFAEQLPEELKESVLTPMGTEKFTSEELFDEFRYLLDNESYVKRQLLAVWGALNGTISHKELSLIKQRLPHNVADQLI
jgi:uncharacterized protein (DUF2267 family)